MGHSHLARSHRLSADPRVCVVAAGTAGFALGWRGWLLASVGSIASIAFISSFKMTYIANVTVIYAIVPFVAAGLEWLFLRERVNPRTMYGRTRLHRRHWCSCIRHHRLPQPCRRCRGAMTLLMALYLVLIRVFSATPVMLAGGLAAAQLFVVGWLFTDPLAVSQADMIYLALFGMTFAIATIFMTEGARLMPAAEVGLIGSADIPMAILFAMLLLGEFPPLTSIAGGAIVVATLAVYAVAVRKT